MNCFKIFFNYKKQFHRQRNGDKMGIKLKNAALAFALGALFIPLQSQAQSDSVKIAFITDMSGLYSDFDGPGGLDAVRMAVSDFGDRKRVVSGKSWSVRVDQGGRRFIKKQKKKKRP